MFLCTKEKYPRQRDKDDTPNLNKSDNHVLSNSNLDLVRQPLVRPLDLLPLLVRKGVEQVLNTV
jgi:hypothetical protein